MPKTPDDLAADFEADPTSISQIPQQRDAVGSAAGAPSPRPSQHMTPLPQPLAPPPMHPGHQTHPNMGAVPPPQQFASPSPQLSNMGATPIPAYAQTQGMPAQMPPQMAMSHSQPMQQPAMDMFGNDLGFGHMTGPHALMGQPSAMTQVPGGNPIGQVSGVIAQPTPYVSRSRIYAFVVDETGMPIELGSGRFAKAYLGEERWVESKTTLRRPVAIKALQRNVSGEDQMRFQMEKEILERVQGHPNIVELLGSGEGDSAGFIPPAIREKVENDFMILELLDMSLEERLKGARQKRRRDDLLAVPLRERIFRVLEYIIPVATAVEFAHLVRDTCHRDIKPANILVKLADPNLRGSQMKIKLADFNVGKVADPELDVSMTRFQAVPGTLYFQSPEQETNTFELLVNCTQGSPEVEFFEDFYIDIYENDTFSLFNRNEMYSIAAADRTRKKILLNRPFAEGSEINVRGRVVKSVGRPADIYSLGAVFYYLISGAYANPKNLFDAFRKFVEYEKRDENNSISAYVEHEYRTIQNMRAPKAEGQGAPDLAPEDRFFSYKHYLDGNGELIDPMIMLIIAKAMIRNKPDSYCLSYDLRTTGISAMVHDLLSLYIAYGIDPSARIAYTNDGYNPPKKQGAMRRTFDKIFRK
ncbi:MAG TPA: protein kinase [Kofleriaceae bacterium]|jgi:serine/threonine protein kinase